MPPPRLALRQMRERVLLLVMAESSPTPAFQIVTDTDTRASTSAWTDSIRERSSSRSRWPTPHGTGMRMPLFASAARTARRCPP
jgi:hypothetical protein